MGMFFAAIVFGLAGLVYSSDRLVDASSALAKNLGVSPLMIGLTIIALGTSAPEILVSATAAMGGHGPLAVGNALGSNIANIGLILGITALIAPLTVAKELVRKEGLVLLGVTCLTGLTLVDEHLSRIDAAILLAALIALLAIVIRSARRDRSQNTDSTHIPTMSNGSASVWLLFSLAALLACSKALVWGAVGIAESYGVNEALIGLTLVAIGTSLPELAASVAAAMKGEQDIAVGNVVGSNILNLIAVLPIAALIQPFSITSELLYRDFVIMLGFTITLILMIWIKIKGARGINRIEGGVLLVTYAAYIAYIGRHTFF